MFLARARCRSLGSGIVFGDQKLMGKWAHPESVMLMAMLGKKPRCVNCIHIKRTGIHNREWCHITPSAQMQLTDKYFYCYEFKADFNNLETS